ncbi:MAG: COG1615 family transporter, partial [Symploca sp. SIO1C4]|nr:COG1615 family transporter [Symploca sp. SIO1C4]
MARREKHTSLRSRMIIALLVLTTLLLLLSGTLVHLLTEVWWFETVGFSSIFWTILIGKSLIWLGTFVLFALFLWWNLRLAIGTTPTDVEQLLLRHRSLRYRSFSFLEGRDLNTYVQSFSKYIGLVVIIFISLIAAGASVGNWETILKYLHASDFGNADPVYQQDIGFYIFQLPFYESLRNCFFALLVCALMISVPVYILKGSIYPGRSWKNLVSGQTKTHLSILLAAIVLLIAISFWLERYDLLYSQEGVVFGAGYTDVHARLLSLWIMSLGALALAALFIVSVWQNSTALPIYGIGLYLVALVIFRGVYPWFQQQFIVEPNELAKEKPYIANNIELTKQAYGLDTVQRLQYPAKTQLNQQVLQENQGTIDNIRLWDYRPLLSTYRQLQEIRLYYKFTGVDIDRYTLNGNYQQVMLSPRELSYEQVPQRARTWVNQRLKYTHGYGLGSDPVNWAHYQAIAMR